MNEAHRIGFVIERALGHITHAENLRHWVDREAGVDPHWMMIPHQAQDTWDKLPGMPFSVRLSLRARDVIRQRLLEQELDCLYLHTQNLSLFSLGLMRRIPTVISLDATPRDFTRMAQAYGSNASTGLVDQLKSAWYRRAFAGAAGLVGMSNWVKDSLVRDYGVPAGKVKVFPFGVDVRRWQPVPGPRVPGRRLRLLFVGGDFKRKGGYEVLEAFQMGLSGSCELDIVTSEPTISPGSSVRVHSGLAPNSAPLRKLYAEADLFLLPSRGDATPIAILEAMASGLPVITTGVGAIPEMVEDGVTGYLVPPSHPQAIVDAVTFLEGHREALSRMGQAARATVEEKFDAQTICKHLLAFLAEVSEHRRDGSGHR